MSEMPYITAAYTISWLAVLGYAMYLFVRSQNAKRRVAEAAQQIGREVQP